jgi:hypothetical protein
MKVLALRFCTVSPEAQSLAGFFNSLGIPQMDLSGVLPPPEDGSFGGAIFTANESWIEVWPEGPGMGAGTMLQIVVDNSDEFAAHAKKNGLNPEGPMDAHGEHIYFIKAPGGMQVAFQSALPKSDA